MPLFTRFFPSRPSSPPSDSPTSKTPSPWTHVAAEPTPPPTLSPSPRPSPETRPSLTSNTSWDISTFPETSYLYPEDRNGDWRNATVDAIKHPSAVVDTVNDALSRPHLRDSVAEAVENISEGLQDSLNRAFEGHDVPAMHDRMMALVPSMSMPSLREVGRRVDGMADRAQAVLMRRKSVNDVVGDDMVGGHLSFAHRMGAKARRALIRQGICRGWQINARESVEWRAKLDAALSSLFDAEKDSFTTGQLFAMEPIWIGNIGSKIWKLELDTGITEIVVDGENDNWEEKRVCLLVAFALPEAAGRMRIEDVERGVVDGEDDWMAVQ